MSEDVKPRQFWINEEAFKTSNTLKYIAQKFEIREFKGTAVIELDPTLQLLKEMGEALDEVHPDNFVYDEGDENIKTRDQVVNVLEKYRKFLEGISK